MQEYPYYLNEERVFEKSLSLHQFQITGIAILQQKLQFCTNSNHFADKFIYSQTSRYHI